MPDKKYYRFSKPPAQYSIFKVGEDIGIRFFSSLNGSIEKWDTIEVLASIESGIISDYTSTDIGGKLCSESLKKLIDKHKSDTDVIQWLPVNVRSESTGKVLKYYHLHFPEQNVLIDENLTVFENIAGRKLIRKPVLSMQKIQGKKIFACPGYESISTVVSEDIRKIFESEEITGINSSTTLVSD